MGMKDAIIHETINLFNKKGYQFTLDELSTNLKISKKTIYKYFENKEDIFRTFIIESFNSVHEQQRDIYNDNDLSTKEKLVAILTTHSKYEDSLTIEKTAGLENYYPELYQLILSSYKTEWDNVESLLNKGMEEGIFKRDFNIQIVKYFLINGMQMMHKKEVLDAAKTSYREGISQIIEIFIRGISA